MKSTQSLVDGSLLQTGFDNFAGLRIFWGHTPDSGFDLSGLTTIELDLPVCI